MITAKDIRKGTAILFNNEIHVVLECQHVSPGNLRAFVQAQMRNIRTGRLTRHKFSSTEYVESVELLSRDVQFLYKDQNGFHFMDLADYNQYTLNEEVVGDAAHYMPENIEMKILFHEETPIEVSLPTSVLLKVINTIPGVKGDSVTNMQKPATLETGYELSVPLFIKEGDRVKIDTRTGEYTGRE